MDDLIFITDDDIADISDDISDEENKKLYGNYQEGARKCYYNPPECRPQTLQNQKILFCIAYRRGPNNNHK